MRQVSLFARLPYSLWLVMWLICAACLWWVLFPSQLSRGCWLGEWPFEQGCNADRPTGFASAEPLKVYPAHLQKNPGDAVVYTWLALRQWQAKDPHWQQSVDAALNIAPIDTKLLMLHANSSLESQHWRAAAVSLIRLVEMGITEANEPLLRLMTSDTTRPFVIELITRQSTWLDRLLRSNESTKLPMDRLLSVYSHGKNLGLISDTTTVHVIDRLQSSGRWLEAYSIWLSYQGAMKEGFFNGGFDQQVSQKAFDWKWLQSADTKKGMLVRQISAHPKNGMALELELIGRSAVSLPMVSQAVILMGDSYIFRGRYQTDKLQTSEGLSWKFSCASGGEPWAQTNALNDTQRQWKDFELKLKVPTECGFAILVGLETKNRAEARAGLTGVVQFDDISLTAENRP